MVYCLETDIDLRKYKLITFVVATILLLRGEVYAQWEPTAFPDDRPATGFALGTDGIYASGNNLGGVIFSIDNGISWFSLFAKNTQFLITIQECNTIASVNRFVVANIFAQYAWDSMPKWQLVAYDNSTSRWSGIQSYGLAERTAALQSEDSYLYCFTKDSMLYQSDNSGASFINITNGMIGEVRKVVSDGKYLYAATYNGGGVYRSSNLGASWDYFNNEMKAQPITDCINMNGKLLAVSNGIWISDDSAVHWRRIHDDKTITSIAISGRTLFAGGENFYLSVDSGVSWQNISSGLMGHHVRSISMNDKYLFALLDSGIWRRSLRDFPSSVASQAIVYRAPLLINYANEVLTIKYSSNAAYSQAKLELFDLLGRLLITKSIPIVMQGWNTVECDVHSLQSGYYICRLSIDKLVLSKNLLLQK